MSSDTFLKVKQTNAQNCCPNCLSDEFFENRIYDIILYDCKICATNWEIEIEHTNNVIYVDFVNKIRINKG